MKNLIISLVIILSVTGCTENQETKAQKIIKNHLKETLDDYNSYSPINFSKVDSLLTKWDLPTELESDFKELILCADKLNESGYNNIDVTSDANYHLNIIDKYTKEKNKKFISNEFLKKMQSSKQLWTEFKHYQDIIYNSKRNFVPTFIGWKVIHKYRAKNMYNATVLKNQEFRLDKDMTQVVSVIDIDNE